MSLTFHESTARKLTESERRVIVTGAGGWLGRATLEMLEGALGERFDARVVAIAAQPRKVKLRSGRETHFIDFKSAQALPEAPTLLAHYAFLTRDKVAASSLSDYAAANRLITTQAIELADRLNVDGIFVVSSGAVYERGRSLASSLEKNPYGFLKQEEEEAFTKFAQVKRCRLSLCRLFNLSGPFIHKEFALNSILLSILERRDIELRATHEVVRDFIHVRDLVSLGFAMMLDADHRRLTSFDSGIGQPIEIGALAQRAIDLLDARESAILREKLSGEPNVYVGETQDMAQLCAAYGLAVAGLDEQILDTAQYLKTLL